MKRRLHKLVDAYWKMMLDTCPQDEARLYLRAAILRLWYEEKRYVDMFGKRWPTPHKRVRSPKPPAFSPG
jgi:hypothetical protein